ncbi:hypothetical protein DdX_17565 [Ditylenchus destructor]|uniref:Uncharacterized protein n=1 Tax=Ditylenchus destructor TaxID=166010 RepID=A0AAD4MMC1_9BILA|nr:hypothetical protein DdX_17565 [Ditylenchus destructor]
MSIKRQIDQTSEVIGRAPKEPKTEYEDSIRLAIIGPEKAGKTTFSFQAAEMRLPSEEELAGDPAERDWSNQCIAEDRNLRTDEKQRIAGNSNTGALALTSSLWLKFSTKAKDWNLQDSNFEMYPDFVFSDTIYLPILANSCESVP